MNSEQFDNELFTTDGKRKYLTVEEHGGVIAVTNIWLSIPSQITQKKGEKLQEPVHNRFTIGARDSGQTSSMLCLFLHRLNSFSKNLFHYKLTNKMSKLYPGTVSQAVKSTIFLAAIVTLTSCGGGGGDSTAPTSNVPNGSDTSENTETQDPVDVPESDFPTTPVDTSTLVDWYTGDVPALDPMINVLVSLPGTTWNCYAENVTTVNIDRADYNIELRFADDLDGIYPVTPLSNYVDTNGESIVKAYRAFVEENTTVDDDVLLVLEETSDGKQEYISNVRYAGPLFFSANSSEFGELNCFLGYRLAGSRLTTFSDIFIPGLVNFPLLDEWSCIINFDNVTTPIAFFIDGTGRAAPIGGVPVSIRWEWDSDSLTLNIQYFKVIDGVMESTPFSTKNWTSLLVGIGSDRFPNLTAQSDVGVYDSCIRTAIN